MKMMTSTMRFTHTIHVNHYTCIRMNDKKKRHLEQNKANSTNKTAGKVQTPRCASTSRGGTGFVCIQ